jgi:hypothetical protein
VQSPKSDIFVALLSVALGAMVLGCLLLIIVLGRYEFKTKVSATTRAPAAAVVLGGYAVPVSALTLVQS